MNAAKPDVKKALRELFRRARGSLAALAAGGAAWGLLVARGLPGIAASHVGGLLAAAALAFSPWRGQLERVVLATLVVFHLGVASPNADDPLFLPLFAGYAVLLCRALLEVERFRRRRSERELPAPVGWRAQLGLTSAVLAVALVLFAVIPRPSKPVRFVVGDDPPKTHSPPAPPAQGAVSGYDEHPDLNESYNASLDSSVVAEVQVFDDAGKPTHPKGKLRLRGRCFDSYRDGVWRRTSLDTAIAAENDGQVLLSDVPHQGRSRMVHEVTLFSLRTKTVLSLPEAESIAAERLWSDRRGNLTFEQEPNGEVRYRVTSWAVPDHPRGIDSVAIPAPPEELLVLPEGLDFLGQMARRAVGADPSPWGKAKRIQEWLEAECTYDLSNAPPSPGRDPVVDFLYRGSGFCVHFASAMALMLRSVGVPARFATGFVVREWDDEGKKFPVRNWDAHAWVEVPFPGYGWVPFDPSPTEGSTAAGMETPAPPTEDSTPEEAQPSEGAISRVQKALAGFGGETQSRAWEGVLARARRFWPFLGALALGAAFTLWLRARRVARAAGGRAPLARRGAGFYDEFARLASRRGVRPTASATPLEYAERVETAFAGLDASRLVRIYYAARYGGRRPEADDMTTVRRILADLQARRSGSPGRGWRE